MWLDPAATKGGVHPYLFSQSQAIHARSLFPCMDSPGIKCTYSATVRVPAWCTVLMSALSSDESKNKEAVAVAVGVAPTANGSNRVFCFTQPVPVSVYLIAIAAGELDSREISHRVRVWAEPSVVAGT